MLAAVARCGDRPSIAAMWRVKAWIRSVAVAPVGSGTGSVTIRRQNSSAKRWCLDAR
jgi:hypothetical protein